MEQQQPAEDEGMTPAKRLHLIPGGTYRVIKAFTDADGKLHLAGEEWVLLQCGFSRFENEYVITVEVAPWQRETFGLICEEEKQYPIIRNFKDYVTKVR